MIMEANPRLTNSFAIGELSWDDNMSVQISFLASLLLS